MGLSDTCPSCDLISLEELAAGEEEWGMPKKKFKERENPCGHDFGPEGYMAWSSWAADHSDAGSENALCEKCDRYYTTVDRRPKHRKKYWKDLGYT
jgi:hypothetical protein